MLKMELDIAGKLVVCMKGVPLHHGFDAIDKKRRKNANLEGDFCHQ